MSKRAILLVSPQLFVDFYKDGGIRAFQVDANALPKDARVVDVKYINSGQRIALELESESFDDVPEHVKPPMWPPVDVSVVFVSDVVEAEDDEAI